MSITIRGKVNFTPTVSAEEILQYIERYAKTEITQAKVRQQFADLFGEIEKHDKPVDVVEMAPSTYRAFRTFIGLNFDPETQPSKLKKCIMGTLWGAEVRINRTLAQDEIILWHGTLPWNSELWFLG